MRQISNPSVRLIIFGSLDDLEIYLTLPLEDEEYRLIAERTAALLKEIVNELDGGGGEETPAA